MNQKTLLQIFQVFPFVIGFGWLAFIDWRIAVCVFLTHWANNANNELKGFGP